VVTRVWLALWRVNCFLLVLLQELGRLGQAKLRGGAGRFGVVLLGHNDRAGRGEDSRGVVQCVGSGAQRVQSPRE